MKRAYEKYEVRARGKRVDDFPRRSSSLGIPSGLVGFNTGSPWLRSSTPARGQKPALPQRSTTARAASG